jgi:hypothetical protein
MTPESKLKLEVKAYLDGIGAYYFMPVQMGLGAATVDFLCCVKGRFVAIETKIWPRRATPRQMRCLTMVREAGGLAFVAYDISVVRVNLSALAGPTVDRIAMQGRELGHEFKTGEPLK